MSYVVFWRRMLLVVIGLGTAAIVTLVLRPPLANRHYRYLFVESVATAKGQYALLAAKW